jgi:hypothetical protein
MKTNTSVIPFGAKGNYYHVIPCADGCGAQLKRHKNTKHAVCFNCKKKKKQWRHEMHHFRQTRELTIGEAEDKKLFSVEVNLFAVYEMILLKGEERVMKILLHQFSREKADIYVTEALKLIPANKA